LFPLAGYAEDFGSFASDLPSKFIKEIRDGGGYLWIATARGLIRHDKKSGKGLLYNKSKGLPDDFITSVTLDPEGFGVWVGTPSGLGFIDLKTDKVTVFTKKNSRLSDNKVNTVLLFRGVVFVGTAYGIDTYTIATNQWKSFTAIEGLAGGNIQSLDSDGRKVWAGGSDGISSYDFTEDLWESFGVENGLNSNLVSSVLVNHDVVWVGTMGGGLSRFDRSTLRFDPLTSEEGLIDDNVQALVDDGRYVWVGTFGGLSRLDKNSLVFSNFDSRDGITEVSITTGDIDSTSLYLGTDGGGIFNMKKQIPVVELFSDLSGYRKQGEFELVATLGGDNNISDLKAGYRQIASADQFDYTDLRGNQPFVEIKGVSKRKIERQRLLVVPSKNLKDGKYLLEVDVKDSAGMTNQASIVFIVDNTPPGIDLFFRAPAEGEKISVVSGTYKELDLDTLDVYIGNKKVTVDLNRQTKRFRFDYPVQSAEKIRIEASDRSGNKTTLIKDFIVDRDPPVLTVDEVDVSKISGNLAEITGTVVDVAIDQVVVLPDNIVAELELIGADKYRFKARASIKKEGVYVYQISATDKSGKSTVKSLEVNFVSKITIVEQRKDLIPEFTLKDNFMFSGNILGPLLSEFYLVNDQTEERLDIRVADDKSFSQMVRLEEGDNQFTLHKVYKDGRKEEEKLEIRSSDDSVAARFELGSNSFSEEVVTLRGTYDPGVKKVFVDKKEVSINASERSFLIQHKMRPGRNIVELSWLDELNRVSSKKYTFVMDKEPPEIYIRTPAGQTGLQTITVTGKVSDNVIATISGYPGVEIQKLDPETGEFEALVKLVDGQNMVHFFANDAAGNKVEKVYIIDYNQNFPKKQVSDDAVTEELEFLRAEIARLQRELRQGRRDGGGTPSGSGSGDVALVRAPLPKTPGLHLVPMAGKIKSYSLTARLYLGSEKFGGLLAEYNGQDPKYMKDVLVPNPSLFNLISESRYRDTVEKVIRSTGVAFHNNRSVDSVRKSVLQFLLRSHLLKEVREIENQSVFVLTNGMVVVISSGKIRGSSIKAIVGGRELLSAIIGRNGVTIERF